ncbi:uncharacterized protein [Pleurodeles waltl]|uniref:uncharacterized protein n=1 Tax=Pleurodeles waltl TaxID=8319 RepID=UPI0037095BF9
MKEPNTAAEHLFLEYIAYYEERWLQGKLSPCNEEATKEKAKHILVPASYLCEEFGGATLHNIIATYLRKHNDQDGDTLKNVIRAFEFLELISVNLFLSPWRKEIKSLKTFTGSFVYNVRSVLPETVVKGVLHNLGYSTLTATEFQLTEKIDEKKSQNIAFQIFLARIECELILELSNGGKKCNLIKCLRTRAALPGKNEVEEQETRATFKNDPQKLVNANIKKNNTWPISKNSLLSIEGLPPGARDTEMGGRFEADKVTTTSTIEMYQPETTVGLVIDDKEAYNTKQSTDFGGKGIGLHISDSDESRRNNKLTNCSELQYHMKNNQGLSSPTSADDIKIGSKLLNSQKTPEKTIMDSNGLNNGKSPIEKTKIGNKGMSPSNSAENKWTDSKRLNTSRPNENTELDSKVQLSSKSAESIKLEGHSGLKSKKDTNVDSTVKELPESVEVTKANSRVLSDSESSQDIRASIGRDRSDPAADMRNEDVTDISSSASKNFGVGFAGQSTEKSSASKSLASECFHSTRSESEEFLTQYSDINIGRKPLFQGDCHQKYKKLKENKSGPGLGGTVLEEAPTAVANPQIFCENGHQTFAFCTDTKVDAITEESKAVSEQCDFTDGSNFTMRSPLFKPLDGETSAVKKKNLSPTIINVSQPNVSNKDDYELASLISKLNISERAEGNLQYPVEESTSNGSEILNNSPQKNSLKAKHSDPISGYPGQSNAKYDHILKMVVRPQEVPCGSPKKTGIDRAATEKSSENCGEVREPPGLTYIPPDSFQNQAFIASSESAPFVFPIPKSEQDPSGTTMPVGDYILQVKEDTKEDFVVISHPSDSLD